MNKIKKAGVCAGIALGAVVGGTVSLIGKMTDQKVIDELGENIMDSTILTGEIVGEVASGTTHVISGAIKKQPDKVKIGKDELGNAGACAVENVINNVRMAADQGSEILEGVKAGDKRRMAKGFRTLGKMMIIGMVTVGAIKADDIVEEGQDAPAQNQMQEASTRSAVVPESAPEAVPEPAQAPEPVPEAVSAPAQVPESAPEAVSAPAQVSESAPEAVSAPVQVPESAPEAVSAPAQVPEAAPELVPTLEPRGDLASEFSKTMANTQEKPPKPPTFEEELEAKIRF